MKNIVKRGFSLLMTLVLCLSLLPAMQASAAEEYTVTFKQDGVTAGTLTGTTITLPEHYGEVPEGYTFEGWVATTVEGESEKPEIVQSPLTVDGNMVLHALYSSTETSGSDDYILVTDASQLTIGASVVIAAAKSNFAISTTQNSNNRAQAAITKSGDKLGALGTSVAVFELQAGSTSGTFAFYDSAKSGYLYAAGSASSGNYLRTAAKKNSEASGSFTITVTAAGVATITSKASIKSPIIRYNSSNNPPLFSCYASGQADISLYAKQAATAVTTYTTTINGAAPEEPVEETYTVSFSVPNHAGVQTPAAMVSGEEGITLPTPTAPAGYTFEGWATASVDETIVAPTGLLTGAYVPTADTTLYAVYSFSKEVVGGSGNFELVKAAPDSWEGEYVLMSTVASTNANYVLKADGSTTPNATTAAKLIADAGMVLSGTTLNGVTDDYIVVIEKSGSDYTLRAKNSTNKYLMTTNSNSGFNYATSTSNDNAKWNLSYANGEAKIANVATSARTIRFNASSKQFRTYTSGQNAVALYAKSAGGTSIVTCYTSDIDLGAQTDDTLKFKGVNLTLADSQHLNFNVLQSVADQYENVYVVFEAAGKETVVLDSYSFTHTDASGAVRYNYAYQNLTILDFDTTVTATIYGTKDGVLYTSSASYSLLTFCDTAITTGTNDDVACAYLLKYVQAAEEYKSVADRIEVPTQLESCLDADIESATPTQTYTLSNGEQVKFQGQYLTMEARTTLNIKVLLADNTVDTSKITVTAAYNDAFGNPVTKTYTFADLVAGSEDGVYVLAFGELYATQMSERVTFTIAVDGVAESTLETSIESYCTGILAGDDSAAMKALATRIFLYGVAAKATYAS